MDYSRWTVKLGPTATLIACAILAGCGANAPDLELLGEVPSFELTNQYGEAFDGDSLRGKVWIADFMFTSCQAACPLMNVRMNKIQAELETEGIQLVSFTVDPEHDTPEVLDAYAQRSHAMQGVWHFLTGTADALNYLCRDVFKLGFVDGSLEHSSRFVLVDRDMQIRGYYSTLQDEDMPDLIRDARGLLGS